MSYDTGASHIAYGAARGINGAWGNEGTDVPAQSYVDVVNTPVAGEVLRVEMATKSKTMQLIVEMDNNGSSLTSSYAESPKLLYDRWGVCMKMGYLHLMMYDTVNNKYLMAVEGPGLRFFDRLKIRLYNPEATAQKAWVACNYNQND